MPPIHLIVRYALIFIGAFIVTTTINTIAWNVFIAGVIYYKVPFFNTEGLDYIFAVGDWIHKDARFTEVINYDRETFKDSQQVLAGWTNRILWIIWIPMFTGSILSSIFLSWWSGREKKTQAEQVAP
jgi:hypothetical protein